MELGRGNLNEAHIQSEASLTIIESVRIRLSVPDWSASSFATARQCAEVYLDVLMHLHQRDPTKKWDAVALQASERLRARSLIQLLTEARLDIRQGIALAAKQRLAALGFHANKALVTSAALSQYRILHFSTYGLADTEHPVLSTLVLALVNERKQEQDGYLRAHEIYNLKLLAKQSQAPATAAVEGYDAQSKRKCWYFRTRFRSSNKSRSECPRNNQRLRKRSWSKYASIRLTGWWSRLAAGFGT